MKKSQIKKSIITIMVFALILSVTAYASAANDKGTEATYDATITYQAPLGNATEILNGLPQDVRENFSHYTDNVNKSVYAHFKAVKRPWKVYFIDMIQANTWLAGVKDTITKDFEKYKKAGLISKYVLLDPNGDLTTQIQQIQTAVEQGANLIITLPLSPSALNAAIKQAYDAGCVVVTIGAPVTSPYAINFDKNNDLIGAKMAAGLVKGLKGKGNILMVDGIAGAPCNEQMISGRMAVLKKNPGIKILGPVNGNWSPSAAKTAIIQYLATHPGKVDAVWQQGSMFSAAYEALQQAGRPIVPVTDSNPTKAGVAIAVNRMNKGWITAYTGIPPDPIADAAFEAGVLTLLGNGPKINTFVCNPVTINNTNVRDWYKPDYSETSPAVADAPAGTIMFPQSMFKTLFTKKPVLPVATMFSGK